MQAAQLPDLAFSNHARPYLYFAWGCFRIFLSRLGDAPGSRHEAVDASRRGEAIQLQAIMR
jgi:hypothetical protein